MIYKSAAISILLFLFSSQLFPQTTMITTPLALTYKIRQSNLTNGRPPLLILLHGIGSNEEDLFSFSNQLPANLLVVSVRAPYTIGNGSYSWFDVDRSSGTPVINPEQAEQSRLTLLKFISQAVDQFHADPQKVFLIGFSQGAIMSYSVALTTPHLVKGIVAMSGRILPQINSLIASKAALSSLHVMIAHGTKDPVIDISNAKAAVELCTSLQVKLSYQTYDTAHQVTQQELADIVSWLNKLLA